MKARIKGNALRYRLTRSDMKRLANEGFLQERVEFANQTLKYELRTTTVERLTADYTDHTITLWMPQSWMNEWVNTSRVGFQNEDKGLHLLIEKDFTCLDNVEEDQSDNYPNPLAK